MAIDTTDSYQEYTADGSTAYFLFNFNYVDDSEIVVGTRTADNTYQIIPKEHYQVIKSASDNGGKIRFIKASNTINDPDGEQLPVDNPPVAGTIVRIERKSASTSEATWQVGLEMSELIALFDKLFRLVQENIGRFDNTIETFATQHGVKLYELLAEHTDKLFYWDNDTKTIVPTDFPRQDVVRSSGGLFFRIKVDESTNTPYLEWSKNGIDNWYGMNFSAINRTAEEAKDKAEQAIETVNDAKDKAELAVETVNSLEIQTTENTQDIAANRVAIGVNESAIAANDVAITENRVAIKKAQDTADAAVTKTEDLQTQIDAMAAASDVADVVGTYADLQAYDTSKLTDNAIIKVLNDETQDGASTYYRWTIGA